MLWVASEKRAQVPVVLSGFLKDILENRFTLFYVSPDFPGRDYAKKFVFKNIFKTLKYFE